MRKLMVGFTGVALVIIVGLGSTGCGKKGTTGSTGGGDAAKIKEVTPDPVKVKAGESANITVKLEAKAKDKLTVKVTGLPDKVTANEAEIAKDADSATIKITAEAKAEVKADMEATVEVGEAKKTFKLTIEAAGG